MVITTEDLLTALTEIPDKYTKIYPPSLDTGYYACYYRNIDLLNWYIRSGGTLTKHMYTLAIANGSTQIINLLYDYRVDPPEHWATYAAASGRKNVIELCHNLFIAEL